MTLSQIQYWNPIAWRDPIDPIDNPLPPQPKKLPSPDTPKKPPSK